MAGEFWLNDRQWAAIEPHLPCNRPGARRVDDRRVLIGILHALTSGGWWQDSPPVYVGRRPSFPPDSIADLAEGCGRASFRRLSPSPRTTSRGSTAPPPRPHRSAGGGKGGATPPAMSWLRGGRTTKSMPSAMAADAPSPSRSGPANSEMGEPRSLCWGRCHRESCAPLIPLTTARGSDSFFSSAALCR